jgi:transcriptional regulator with XRE-family HTH domain
VAAGLSQSEVGARAGVTKSAVSRYEAGAYQPRPRVLHRLAEVLRVPVERFAEGVEDPAEDEPERIGVRPRGRRKGKTA